MTTSPILAATCAVFLVLVGILVLLLIIKVAIDVFTGHRWF